MGSDQEMKHSLKFYFFREAAFEVEPCWLLGLSLPRKDRADLQKKGIDFNLGCFSA